jgi:TonB family protein
MPSVPLDLELCTALAAMMIGMAWAQETAGQVHTMPRLKRIHSVEDYYPEVARRYGQHGRVVVEFKINGRGRAVDPVIVETGPTPQFDDSARRLVKSLEYDVQPGWEQSASADHRYRLSVKYRLFQCVPGKRCDGRGSEPVPDDSDVDGTIKITSSGRVSPS